MGILDIFNKKETISYELLKKSFYNNFKETIINFSKGNDNKDVYAIVFDCDDENGQICLRYANKKFFDEIMKEYDKYKNMFRNYGKYDLVVYKYFVGDFKFIDFEEQNEMKHFNDSYYYYITEHKYFGEGIPYEIVKYNKQKINIKNDTNSLTNIWENLIIECIKQLMNEDLGIDKTDDFVMFMVYHDQSDEDIKKYMLKTIDENTFDKVFIQNKLVK